MSRHKHYKTAYNAFRGTSFSPDKRAESYLQEFDNTCKELAAAGKESAMAGYEALWLKHMHAKARIISPMISGPAGFPAARMQKYNAWERAAGDRVTEFLNKVTKPPATPRHELDYNIEGGESIINGVRVIKNVELNRLQFVFDGKPAPEMLATLKKNSFKWSPKNTAWQRQLTPNALRVIGYILNAKES